jgi:hypothetical protein
VAQHTTRRRFAGIVPDENADHGAPPSLAAESSARREMSGTVQIAVPSALSAVVAPWDPRLVCVVRTPRVVRGSAPGWSVPGWLLT